MSRLHFDLHAVGVLAPGLGSLAELRAACRADRPPPAAPLVLPSPASLPANERRRASLVVRLTLACIEQALASSPFPPDALRSVFATDEGTGEVCQQMMEALATTRQVSPLLFPNSVHNAPSGCFSIAWRNRRSATVASLGLDSFAAGLLCAVTEAAATGEPVMLVAYDPAMSAPMDELLRVAEPTATAWVLSVGASPRAAALASFALDVGVVDGEPPSALPAWLPAAWGAHSSARALAALGLLEQDATAVCRLALGAQTLRLHRVEAGAA
ncbi:MAG TPA: beta-ketoacyl synthase chain length factor [Methylibium sp.]|nr:beta-ketoacyl synthase chain length factor [Methylibium sp.]